MQATADSLSAAPSTPESPPRSRPGKATPCAAQEERLRSHAKSQGWAVYKLYVDDGYSAGSRNRPALKRLLSEAALKRFDVVLVYKIDRLSRSLKDLIDIVAELNQFDVGFKSCTELIDTTRPEGRLMFHQFGSFAQYERELIGQRTRFGMMKRLRAGPVERHPALRLPHRGREARHRAGGGGAGAEDLRLVPAARTWAWWPSAGSSTAWGSSRARETGGRATRIHKMIGNPLYAGFIRWGGETAMGTHEPIISKETLRRRPETPCTGATTRPGSSGAPTT